MPLLGGSRIEELHLEPPRNQLLLVGLVIEPLDGPAFPLAVIEGEIVHVHVHEPPPPGDVQPASEPERVGDGVLLVVERILDAGPQADTHRPHQLRAQVPPHDVEAQRHRELVDLLMTAVFPPVAARQDYGLAMAPFSLRAFHATPPARRLLLGADGTVQGRVSVDAETLRKVRLASAYAVVLRRVYGLDLELDTPRIFTVIDPDTGLDPCPCPNQARFCSTAAAERVRQLAGPSLQVVIDDRALDQRAIEMLSAILVRQNGDGPAAALPNGQRRPSHRPPDGRPQRRDATRRGGRK